MDPRGDRTPSLASSPSPLSTHPLATAPSPNAIYPRPKFYLRRTNGTCTALIEVDQLPDSIRIMGVPAILSLAETAGMVSIGMKDREERRYVVETLGSPISSHPRERPSQSNATNDLEDWRRVVQSHGSQTGSEINNKELVTMVSTLNLNPGLAPARSASEPTRSGTLGHKIYCTHWIRRGECDYVQQGCKYKHEMPDLATLKVATGIRSFPKWWREATGMSRHLRPANQLQSSTLSSSPQSVSLPTRPAGRNSISNRAPSTNGLRMTPQLPPEHIFGAETPSDIQSRQTQGLTLAGRGLRSHVVGRGQRNIEKQPASSLTSSANSTTPAPPLVSSKSGTTNSMARHANNISYHRTPTPSPPHPNSSRDSKPIIFSGRSNLNMTPLRPALIPSSAAAVSTKSMPRPESTQLVECQITKQMPHHYFPLEREPPPVTNSVNMVDGKGKEKKTEKTKNSWDESNRAGAREIVDLLGDF